MDNLSLNEKMNLNLLFPLLNISEHPVSLGAPAFVKIPYLQDSFTWYIPVEMSGCLLCSI